MYKKLALIISILVSLSSISAAQNIVVGDNKIHPVQTNLNHIINDADEIIILSKPKIEKGINLISKDEYLGNQVTVMPKEEPLLTTSNEKANPEPQKLPAEEYNFHVGEENTPTIKEKEEQIVLAKESEDTSNVGYSSSSLQGESTYIYYGTDKKTLLKSENKRELRRMPTRAKEKGLKFEILSYAAGSNIMASRVALLRANIIKNTLKGYGVPESDIIVKALGNQIDANQAKITIFK